MMTQDGIKEPCSLTKRNNPLISYRLPPKKGLSKDFGISISVSHPSYKAADDEP